MTYDVTKIWDCSTNLRILSVKSVKISELPASAWRSILRKADYHADPSSRVEQTSPSTHSVAKMLKTMVGWLLLSFYNLRNL